MTGSSSTLGTAGEPPRRWLGFGILGGPAAWFVHLNAAYALVEIDCRSDALAFGVAGVPAVVALGLLVTVLAAAVATLAAVVAQRHRPAPGGEGNRGNETLVRARFMADTGTIISILFVLAILVGGISFAVLRSCG